MDNITVIGDIHGCYKTFLALLDRIPKGDKIVSVGDLIDRGPYSKEVVQYMIDHPEIQVVLANHEDMCITDMLCENPAEAAYHGEWLVYQAGETLYSYQKDGKLDRDLLTEHAKWMSKLPLYLEFPDTYMIGKDTDMGCKRHLVVSHASIGSTWKFRDAHHDGYHFFRKEALWNRGAPEDVQDIYNVFGHTPLPNGPKIKSFYANIDTGCVFKRLHNSEYATLTALRFPSMEIIQQKNIE